MEKLLKESPFSLVKFQVYAKRDEMKFNDRRLNRVRNKNRIPFGPWARSVAESVLKHQAKCVGLRVIHFLTILKNENYFISQTNHFTFFKKMKNES